MSSRGGKINSIHTYVLPVGSKLKISAVTFLFLSVPKPVKTQVMFRHSAAVTLLLPEVVHCHTTERTNNHVE